MIFEIVHDLQLETSQGIVNLSAGQRVRLKNDQVRLLRGKVKPLTKLPQACVGCWAEEAGWCVRDICRVLCTEQQCRFKTYH